MTDTDNIHVVMGTTGEYSHRYEWPVAAYRDRETADRHANAAMIWAHRARRPGRMNYGYNDPPNPYDPDMRCDRTGTNYHVLTVPLRETFEVAEDDQ